MFANAKLEVMDKYTTEVCTRVALADAEVIDTAIQLAVESQSEMAEMSGHEVIRCLALCVVYRICHLRV